MYAAWLLENGEVVLGNDHLDIVVPLFDSSLFTGGSLHWKYPKIPIDSILREKKCFLYIDKSEKGLFFCFEYRYIVLLP